jgi:hypothetical protein
MTGIAARETRRKVKVRTPVSERSYLFSDEVAGEIGCSVVTVNRLANGSITGIPRLPFVPRGTRGRVFRKATVEDWLTEVENKSKRGNISESNPFAGQP